jgi:hypothetical protein
MSYAVNESKKRLNMRLHVKKFRQLFIVFTIAMGMGMLFSATEAQANPMMYRQPQNMMWQQPGMNNGMNWGGNIGLQVGVCITGFEQGCFINNQWGSPWMNPMMGGQWGMQNPWGMSRPIAGRGMINQPLIFANNPNIWNGGRMPGNQFMPNNGYQQFYNGFNGGQVWAGRTR